MNNKGKIRVSTIIYLVILIIVIVVAKNMYSKYNFYEYVKGVREEDKTYFTRDSEVKYSEMDSYKIENN